MLSFVEEQNKFQKLNEFSVGNIHLIAVINDIKKVL